MGEIDELYIYDRTLSAAEIAWLAGRTQPFDVPFVPEDFSAPTVARQ